MNKINMEDSSKHIEDPEQFWKLAEIIGTFPRIHNAIRSDYLTLLEITNLNMQDSAKFDPLCRACITNLFTLIEADLYYYNLFDAYDGYNDRDDFVKKFKETFKQICKTWNRKEVQTKYFETELKDLRMLRIKRDRLTHPKKLADIITCNDALYRKIKKVFDGYDCFIQTIMTNFFFTTKLSSLK